MLEPWRALVEDARWAPSPHNLQTWLLRPLDHRRAELLYDPGRLLPDTDPGGRFVTVGLGCFVESLAVAAAARGRLLDVEQDGAPLEPSAASRRVAVLTLADGGVEEPYTVELLRARRTSRLPYDGSYLAATMLDEAVALAGEHLHRLSWSQDDVLVRQVLRLNEEALFFDLTDAVARMEVGRWLRFSEREAAERADGFSPSALAFPGWLLRAFFHRHRLFELPVARSVVRRLHRRTLRGTRTVAWLQGPFETPADWLASGRLLQRLWLHLTDLGLHLHPFGSVITNPRANARLHELVRPDPDAGTLWLVVRVGRSAEPPRSHRLPAERLLVDA